MVALGDWKEVQLQRSPGAMACDRTPRWQAPRQGCLQLNVDAGKTGNNSTGMGLIARDSRFTFMFAATHIEGQRLETIVALHWCLEKSHKLKLDAIIVESSSLSDQCIEDGKGSSGH